MLAAAATTVTSGCPPLVCLSPPAPCLSVAATNYCDGSFIVFGGSTTTVNDAARARLDELAGKIRGEGVHARLTVFVFDDGQPDAAKELHQPRLDAVLAALVERGVPAESVSMPPVENQPQTMQAEAWSQRTGDGNPLPLSGLVTIDCPY